MSPGPAVRLRRALRPPPPPRMISAVCRSTAPEYYIRLRKRCGTVLCRGAEEGGDGRACAWEAATIKGMAWPANPVATGCQGNPCSTGIRWGVSPAAQMGCLRNRSGSPSGADQP